MSETTTIFRINNEIINSTTEWLMEALNGIESLYKSKQLKTAFPKLQDILDLVKQQLFLRGITLGQIPRWDWTDEDRGFHDKYDSDWAFGSNEKPRRE